MPVPRKVLRGDQIRHYFSCERTSGNEALKQGRKSRPARFPVAKNSEESKERSCEVMHNGSGKRLYVTGSVLSVLHRST